MMIITATNRLARVRRQEYDWQQQELGLHTWPTAPVKTLNAWLSELWEEGIYSESAGRLPRPLRSAEEIILWEDIMRSSSEHLPLDISATAELASTSWKLLCDWCLPLEGVEWTMLEDARAFQKWALEFQARCKQKGWISISELPRHVAGLIRNRHLVLPHEIELIGFIDPTTAQKHVFEALREYGTQIHEAPLPSRNQQVFRLQVTDSQREIRTAAEWARRILQSEKAADPSFQIGIIVPGIQRLRNQIERIFSEVFHPRSWLHPERDPSRLFNISLGLPATKYPIIQSALQILSIDIQKIPTEHASRILVSPFLPGFKEEYTRRALLDVELRGRREQYVSLTNISYLAEQKNRSFSCPILAGLLRAWRAKFEDLNGTRRPSAWAESFSQLLQSGKQSGEEGVSGALQRIGWPGSHHTGSIEYQTCMVWEELLSELVELDGICGNVTRQRAVTLLHRLASSKIFQPESEPAPVQILGLLEAYGLSFDYLWMLGMHDDAWPPPCEPAPFVPIQLQRRYGLWRSTPEGMLANAQTLGDRLISHTPTVIISHPDHEGDADRRVSPLFADISKTSEEDLGIKSAQSLGEQMQCSSNLEILQDDQGLACDDIQSTGGTYLFKLQAACPFRAFAELRLGATAPASPNSGLDAVVRGRIIHQVLDTIWAQLGSHVELSSMSTEQEAELVQKVVREQLEKEMPFRRILQNEQYMKVEQDRLEKIIGDWLKLERARQPFTVSEQEEKKRVMIGGMENDIREDRVDVLEDGQKVILDYKTGECRSKDWDGNRPKDPQLPVYAAVEKSPIAGIVFGRLKVGEIGFEGITNQKDLIPGINSHDQHLPNVIARWREVLDHLGRNYKNGSAVVDPKNPVETCRYCKLSTFCRIGSSDKNIQKSK